MKMLTGTETQKNNRGKDENDAREDAKGCNSNTGRELIEKSENGKSGEKFQVQSQKDGREVIERWSYGGD